MHNHWEWEEVGGTRASSKEHTHTFRGGRTRASVYYSKRDNNGWWEGGTRASRYYFSLRFKKIHINIGAGRNTSLLLFLSNGFIIIKEGVLIIMEKGWFPCTRWKVKSWTNWFQNKRTREKKKRYKVKFTLRSFHFSSS